MSDLIAREALSRMNMNVVAIAEAYGGFASDLTQMMRTDPIEAHAKFMEQRRTELVEAYGFSPVPQQSKPFAFAEGVAIIPVSGTLINRFGQSYGFVTGYNFIRQQTAMALADDDVKGILYDVNSYGGEAAGCFECANFIYDAGKKKPTMSYVDSNSYSAGYALARAAKRMVVTPSGGAGSVGVVAMWVGYAKMLEEAGIDVKFFVYGKNKVDGNPYTDLSEDAQKSIQASVEKSGEMFVNTMSKFTGKDASVFRDTQARTYRADDALSLGLIDAIAPPEEAVGAFLAELTGSSVQPAKEDAMTQESQQAGATNKPGETTTPAAPAAAAPAAAPAATPAAAPAAAAAAAPAAAPAAAAGPTMEEARAAERARMSGILGCDEAKGRAKLANHLAMETDMSLDAAKKLLAASPMESTNGSAFHNAMNNGKHPNVGADGAGGAGEVGEMTDAEKILRNHAIASGTKYEAAAKA